MQKTLTHSLSIALTLEMMQLNDATPAQPAHVTEKKKTEFMIYMFN